LTRKPDGTVVKLSEAKTKSTPSFSDVSKIYTDLFESLTKTKLDKNGNEVKTYPTDEEMKAGMERVHNAYRFFQAQPLDQGAAPPPGREPPVQPPGAAPDSPPQAGPARLSRSEIGRVLEANVESRERAQALVKQLTTAKRRAEKTKKPADISRVYKLQSLLQSLLDEVQTSAGRAF
jgi:hypothetical protein